MSLTSTTRRVARALDLANIANTAGAASFAFFDLMGLNSSLRRAEVGNAGTDLLIVAYEQSIQRTQHRRPPLQKTQGWGSLSRADSRIGNREGGPAPTVSCDSCPIR
jgi:hypothetical protein